MEKQRKIKILTIVAMVVAILGLTIAFAALSQTLTINGSASVDAGNWDIHFDNLSEAKIAGKAEELNRPDVAEKGASITNINVSLNQPKDEVVYNVDLVNEGSINAEITNIVSPTFTKEQEKYIDFKVVYTDTNKELSIGDLLNANETKNLTITIRYSDDIDKDDLPDEVQNINISYEITYMQTDKEEEVTTAPSEEEAYNVGDEFCIGEECFYVIKDNGDSVTALAKYNLLVGYASGAPIELTTPGYGLQSPIARGAIEEGDWIGTINFSNENYWFDNSLKPEYGDHFPAYVYDENSILYPYVENYESYLKDTLGKTSVEARVISYEELLDIGCVNDETETYCKNAPTWVFNTSYFSGSAGNGYVVYRVGSTSAFSFIRYDYDNLVGIRPVITISKSEL